MKRVDVSDLLRQHVEATQRMNECAARAIALMEQDDDRAFDAVEEAQRWQLRAMALEPVTLVDGWRT